jgi:hypothetical protein
MSNEDINSRYQVWRDKWKRKVHTENIAIYGITSIVMALLPVLAHID